MKCKAALLCVILTGCTPAEVAIVEEVAHEASVAEQAIEHDLECSGADPVVLNPPMQSQQGSIQIKNKPQPTKHQKGNFGP
jgi:hypothetical protein